MSLDPYIDHQQRQGREGELRREFEAWASKDEHNFYKFDLNVRGEYQDIFTFCAYEGFCAGRALAQQQVAPSIQQSESSPEKI